MERVDCVVVGAGVVGLALARTLALRGREVVVLESEDRIGTGISSRNSEVIHGGLYYPAGSLKARLCVAGNPALYAFCAAHGVPHRRCGKLVVATDEGERAALARIEAQARANGVTDLTWLEGPEAMAQAPGLRCVAALRSGSTGILDSHGLMKALQAEAEAHGAAVVLKSPVLGGRAGDGGLEVQVGGAEPMAILARQVFNAAGLGAQAVASGFRGVRPGSIPPRVLAKGNYYSLAAPAPFDCLVYPVPTHGGLGTHLTLDLGGQARFGPDVEWVDREDYTVDPRRADAFYDAVRTYWPGLPDGALQPAYAGIRPKLHGPGQAAPDFAVQRGDAHGLPGLVNLFGIESPGLTASLALAEEVAG